ncbi:MAG: RNA polymerase sigma factor, partial [Solirubrobacteraceae bacterium]
MTDPLTDQRLRTLQRLGAHRAASDPQILALLRDVARSHPQERIHWLTDSRDAIYGDWYERRLRRGRLVAMIDKAGSVASLRALARSDLQQYATEQRRPELPTRLFHRLDDLLRATPDRFTVMLPASSPGATCWTLAERPAAAMFSERDPELKSLVWAVGLHTLEQEPDAAKQTQFILADELARYAYEMLERSARGLTLDQLVRGLVLAYGLNPSVEELPDEATLADDFYGAERQGVPLGDPPALPAEDRSDSARELIAALSPRQLEILMRYRDEYTQREIAEALHCSPATISTEIGRIRTVLLGLGPPEDLQAIL